MPVRFRILAILVQILILGCPFQKVAAGRELNIYFSIQAETFREVARSFQYVNSEIHLNCKYISAWNLVKLYRSEDKKRKRWADLLWFPDPFSCYEIKKLGIFSKYQPSEISKVPRALRDPDEEWTPAFVVAMIMAFNTQFVKDPPDRWRDVIKPGFEHRVGIEAPDISVYSLATVGAIAWSKIGGWGFFRALKKKKAAVFCEGGKILPNLASGEISIGIMRDDTARESREEGTPIECVYPLDGSIPVPSTLAMRKWANNRLSAKKFIDFVISPEGQGIIVSRGLIPARTDIKPQRGIPSLDTISWLNTDWDGIWFRKKRIARRFKKIFGLKPAKSRKRVHPR